MTVTKKEFEKTFREEFLPPLRDAYEQDGRIDYPARREEWINTIDFLVKEGDLPKKAVNWTCPW